MNQSVIEMVNAIMHEQFEVPTEDLKPTALLKDDLKLDSLDFVDMVVLLEEKMGQPLNSPIDFMAIKTLDDVYQLVERLTQEADKLS